MSYKIAIDPGKHSAAWCILEGEAVVGGGFAEIPAKGECRPHQVAFGLRETVRKWWEASGRSIYLFEGAVIEKPQAYQHKFQKGAQQDIHDVSLVAGACASVLYAYAPLLTLVLPKEWKGQIPKAVTKARIDAALTREERQAVTWPRGAKAHNVYDAIHLGLRTFTKRKV